jgi:hypothetical protein
VTGRVVLSTESRDESTKLNLENLSGGVYYFKVMSAGKVETRKIIKN